MIYISLLGLFLAFLYFILPRFERYFIERPNLVVELDDITSIQKDKKYSSKNSTPAPIPDEIWYIYDFEWYFNLIVRNNSEINAYDIKLFQKNGDYPIELQEHINMQKALKAHEEITLPFKISAKRECLGSERENIFANQGNIFKTLSIILEYKNPKGTKFYTTFLFDDKTNDYKRITSYELKHRWHLNINEK